MLEEIKGILIGQKEQQLNKKEELDKKIQEINKKAKEQDFSIIDKKLNSIENQVAQINQKFFLRLFSQKKLKELNNEYKELSNSKIRVLEEFNLERERLITELSILVHYSGSIEQEIIKIKQAKTLGDLGLTEEAAKMLIRNYHNHLENSIIQKVFLTVLSKNPTTREEIFRIMQELYQTNSSAFVVEMQKINPTELTNQLIEIGIIIDKDKLGFINEIYHYLNGTSKTLPTMENIKIDDRLDHYYCNEVEKALTNIKNYPNIKSNAISQLMSLTAIVSIAKEKKKEKQNESYK